MAQHCNYMGSACSTNKCPRATNARKSAPITRHQLRADTLTHRHQLITLTGNFDICHISFLIIVSNQRPCSREICSTYAHNFRADGSNKIISKNKQCDGKATKSSIRKRENRRPQPDKTKRKEPLHASRLQQWIVAWSPYIFHPQSLTDDMERISICVCASTWNWCAISFSTRV